MGFKVGFFGSFYPLVDRLATTSTGLVYLFADSSQVDKIELFSPVGSIIPPELETNKIRLNPLWCYNSVLSLIRTFFLMRKKRKTIDTYFFNIYLTSFGTSRLANFVGLLIPPLLSRLTHREVIVYMHNFIETQDVDRLGYNGKSFSKRIARILEKVIAINTNLVVPLPSQSAKLRGIFRKAPRDIVIPYVEGLFSFLHLKTLGQKRLRKTNDLFNILLFGSWGPQKNLKDALSTIGELFSEGMEANVVVAGSVNSGFPYYLESIEHVWKKLPANMVTFRMNVPEEEIPGLFQETDLLFLPYNATGGYSAVMNVGALYGVKMLAYDLPELREFSSLIESDCVFVDPKDHEALKSALRVAISARKQFSNKDNNTIETRLGRTFHEFNKFVSLMSERNKWRAIEEGKAHIVRDEIDTNQEESIRGAGP